MQQAGVRCGTTQSPPSRPIPSATPNLVAVLAMALSAALLAIMLSVTLDLPRRLSDDAAQSAPALKGASVQVEPLAHASKSLSKAPVRQCRDGTMNGVVDRLICL